MKTLTFLAWLLLGVFLYALCLAPRGFSQIPGFTVNPPEVPFDSHDIGTTTPRTVVLRNGGTAALNLSVTLEGVNPNEFKWSSTCLSNLAPGAACDVIVSFTPQTITKSPDRIANLVIRDEKSSTQTVSLKGSAFPNLGVSLSQLDFAQEMIGKTSSPRTLVVTNYSDSPLTSISIAVSGDFTETHSKCDKIGPDASCAVGISFAPKAEGPTSGSLTITADQSSLGKLPRVVALQGKGVVQCNGVVGASSPASYWLTALIGGLYFLALALVRWHMIAKPARAQLIAQINAVRAEAGALPATDETKLRIERVNFLLDWALYPLKNKHFPVYQDANTNKKPFEPDYPPGPTRFFNAVFWPRGTELAGWSCSHQAELMLVGLLPADRVRAQMETAELQLRALKDPTVAGPLADRLRDAHSAAPSSVSLDRCRALLVEGLGLLYESGDDYYFNLATWHSKMMWLVGAALLLIFGLIASLHNAILLLLGAVGGLLSRLAQTVRSSESANDYGASWGGLFLSPLSGALSAWAGILLISLGLKFNIFGSAVNVDWCNPYEPATLALAVLFGFSERLFTGLASQIEGKIGQAPPSQTPPAAKPAPSIVSVDPPKGELGKSMQFAVHGSNFVSGAIATVTNEQGDARPATIDFQDASNLTVTATLTGTQPFTSTLTVINPDKQSARCPISAISPLAPSQQPAQPAPKSGKPPSVTSLEPPKGIVGQPLSFTVHGQNFVDGATATVTDDKGNVLAAKVDFNDPAKLVVALAAILQVTKAFKSTLTITNPDKQSVSFPFDVA